MRIGLRTRVALEALITTGFDLLEFGSRPTSALARGCTGHDEHRFRRQMERMREAGLIELQEIEHRTRWVVAVTALGQSKLRQQIEPVAAWSRPWDGKWRILNFDLPARARDKRFELNNWLALRRFGRLQGSACITPFFPAEWMDEIARISIRPSDVSFFEGRPFGGNTDADFVATAWSFKSINANYQRLITHHRSAPDEPSPDWLTTENLLWKTAFEADPFLPNPLLPTGYLGKAAHALRTQTYTRIFAPKT